MATDQQFAHDVLRSIRQIVRRISEHSKTLSREFGLTVPQLMCLKAVGDLLEADEETTVIAVAAKVGLSAPTVSRIVDRLVRAALLDRERGVQDRRRVVLTLTTAGRLRFDALPVPLHEQFVSRFQQLPIEERHQLVAALHRITQLMDASDLDAAPILSPGSDLE